MLKGEMLQQEKGLILCNLEGILQLLAFLSLHVRSLDRDRNVEEKTKPGWRVCKLNFKFNRGFKCLGVKKSVIKIYVRSVY